MPESETPRTRQYDLQKANAWSLVFFAVLIPGYLLPYYAIWVGAWEWEQIQQVLKHSADNNSLIGSLVFFLLVVGGIVVHELIYGLTRFRNFKGFGKLRGLIIPFFGFYQI